MPVPFETNVCRMLICPSHYDVLRCRFATTVPVSTIIASRRVSLPRVCLLCCFSSCLLIYQESTHHGGNRYKHGGQRGWLRGVLSSSPMWDRRGRIKVGAFTAELGKWRQLPCTEEVRDTVYSTRFPFGMWVT